jgi:crotonobetainyl-CoA:carnitine CoA-transferase CaiB-like acyl-CoA transferase
MPGPLEGLTIVDCSGAAAGPRATGILADYGADVLWIEPRGGDPWRRERPAANSVFNRGKRSLVLDVAEDSDRQFLLGLIDGADVFVESWRPGEAEGLGLGWDDLHARSPRLVYCSISGFGTSGPHRDLPDYEALVHALVGTMGEQAGHREGPIFQGLPFASIGAAYLALIGVLGALLRREQDGHGRKVETSLWDGALAYLSMLWGESDESVANPTPALRPGGTSTMRLITRSFQCADDEFIGIHTGAVGAFGRLMKVLGLDDRVPPSETGMDIGVPLNAEQQELLFTELPRLFRMQPRDYWVKALLEADICGIEHLRPGEVFDTEQARHNGMVVTLDDPVLGPVEQVGPAAMIPAQPASVVRGAPRPGEHRGDFAAPAQRAAPANTVDASPNRSPLFDGLKVLDLGAYYAGPYSSRLLADLGADVIKLEPTHGDQLRGLERPFYSAQAGKRSLAVNMKDPDVRPAVEALVRWADVVHHNMRPGAAERLGLDYEHVQALNPQAVYLYAPGWGSSGPHRLRQSFAPMMSGYAGVTFEVAGAFNEPLPPTGNEDPGNGLLGAVAVLMGLLLRHRTGSGTYIENPQLNATMAHMAHAVRTADGTVVGAGFLDTLQFGNSAVERLYQTRDGWVCLACFRDDEFARLAETLEVPDLREARFATAEGRRSADDELAALLTDAFARHGTEEAVMGLRAAGVPVAVPATHHMHAIMNDPDQRRTGRVAEVRHPSKGHVRELAVLVRVSDAEVPAHRLAPELGQHSDEILTSVGFAPGTIRRLRSRGSVK